MTKSHPHASMVAKHDAAEKLKKQGPTRYRYVGFDDFAIYGIGIRHNDVVEVNDGIVKIVEHGTLSKEHFDADDRFEEISDETADDTDGIGDDAADLG